MAVFDPRRAEPGQEFSYVQASVDRKVDETDEIPEGADDLGLVLDGDGEPTGKRTIRVYGVERTLKADAEGVVHPKTAQDEQVLLSFGLPVARKAIAEEAKADSKKAEG